MAYSVELSNGRKFSGLKRNADVYISDSKVTSEMFAEGLSLVKVRAEAGDEWEEMSPVSGEYEGCELLYVARVYGKWEFAIRGALRG